MRNNFQASLDLVLVHEGGFVNHPKDPGGPTNLGITIGTLSEHLGRPATVADVKALSRHDAGRIYRRNYWDRARCDDLPLGLDYAVFDFAVNSGVSRAVRTLQRVLGVKEDGVIGAKTMGALADEDVPTLIDHLCNARMAFLRGLKTFGTFGKGWTRRVEAVEETAHNMHSGQTLHTRVEIAPAPAREEDQKVTVALKDPAVLTAAGSIVSGVLAAGSGTGPLAYALAAVLVLAAVAAVILIARRDRL